MKQIMLIADSDPRRKVIGGVGIYAYNLARYLTNQGYQVQFIGKKHDGPTVVNFQNLDYIEVNKKANQSNYTFLMNLFGLVKKLELHDTVIHSQRPDWLIPFKDSTCKKIVTLHGSHSKNVYLKKGKIMGSVYSYLEKKGLMLADKIISVSKDNTAYYKQKYKKYPQITNKILTVPVGIDIAQFGKQDKLAARKKYGFHANDKIVVYIGRFEQEKNLEMLIRACHNAKLKAFLVGSGKQEQYLKEVAKKLESDTIFHDAVDNATIPEILSCADTFALTSLYEGLPTVVIEALAAGLPVVSTDVGDVKDLVIDGITGYIVNEENIVEKLRNVTKNPANFRDACIHKAQEYTWDIIGKQIVEAY